MARSTALALLSSLMLAWNAGGAYADGRAEVKYCALVSAVNHVLPLPHYGPLLHQFFSQAVTGNNIEGRGMESRRPHIVGQTFLTL